MAKMLIAIGAGCIAIGLLLLLSQKLGMNPGRLPGDFSWRGKHGSFHFPLATSLIVSIVLTVLINLWLGRTR